MKKVLVINSAKGGVGKTEVTKGIATELSSRGENVTILDLDVTTPNIGELDDIKTFIAVANSILTKPQIKKLIKEAVDSCDDGWLLIDTPPTISALYSAITETIINAKFLFVTTPSPNALTDTNVGIKFFAQRGVIPIGIIQNMVGEILGEEIDSEKIMGVKTIGVIPFVKDTSSYFHKIVNTIDSIKFNNATAKEDEIRIMSTLTISDIEYNLRLTKKFYNLETWPIMRERILEEEFIGFGNEKSHYNIRTSDLEKIINQGQFTNVFLNQEVSVEHMPMQFEIQEAEIFYDHKYSKGLPMFRLKNGVTLWHHECSLASDMDIKNVLDQGGFDMGDGRIIQSLFIQMYMNRAFKRNAMELEKALIERHIQESGHTPSKKYILYSIYTLEKDGDLSYEDFSMNEYIENQKEKYPDFHKHLLSVGKLGE